MNYTKGDWKIAACGDVPGILHTSIVDNSGRELAHLLDGKPGEKLANANLIAAAPDMYEALKKLIEETDLLDIDECEHDVGICWCSYKNARFQAAHVLAKAEGKEAK